MKSSIAIIYVIVEIVLNFFKFFVGIVETIAGGGRAHKGKDSDCNDFERSKDGIGADARFNYPWGIAYDFHNNQVYVADCVIILLFFYSLLFFLYSLFNCSMAFLFP